MSRSLRKGPYIQEALEKRILAMNEGSMKKEVVKTWSRASMISPDFVGHTIAVHNGNKFTADDVVYTIERMMNPDTAALNTDFFSMIKGANARLNGEADHVEGAVTLDDYTVEITLEVPFAPFLANLATPSCSIYNREATEAAGDQFGIEPSLTIGTGPFQLSDWVLNDKVTLVRNDDYFKGAHP